MNELYYIQKQITINIIEVLNSKGIQEKDYIDYLYQRTPLSKKRLMNLLDIEIKKRMTIKEIGIIAIGLGVEPAILLQNIQK